MSNYVNVFRHENYDGLTSEHASSVNQTKNATPRTVAGTAVEFGPFEGDYEFVAVNDANDGGSMVKDANITATTGHADNLVYRMLSVKEHVAAVAAVANNDHIWPAALMPSRIFSFTKEYPYISLIRTTDSGKTMRISIARVKGRS